MLVIECDEPLRGTLRAILDVDMDVELDSASTAAGTDTTDTADTIDATFLVVEVDTEADGFSYLAARPPELGGMLVICSNRDPDHYLTEAFFTTVVARPDLATHHRYLLLSTDPGHISPTLAAALARVNAVVLPKPFNMEELLAHVHNAAAHLAAASDARSMRGMLYLKLRTKSRTFSVCRVG